MRRAAIWLGTIATVTTLALPASALAAEVLTASPSLAGTAGGPGLLTIKAGVVDSLGGVPSPLTQLAIDIPPGVTYNFDTTPVCSINAITAATGTTPPVCPTGSKIGSGSSSVEAVLGSVTINETASLDIYLLQRSPVKYEVWANGVTPIEETLTFPGTFTPTAAPFAEKILVNIPPIPTVEGGPDASVTSLDFTVGGNHTVTTTKKKHGKKSVTHTTVGLFDLPKNCTSSVQLPYAATASFSDGSTVPITGKVACP